MTASDAGAHPVLRSPGMCDDSAQGSDHPVGVVLDESRGLLEGGRLRAARAVDRRVRLFDRTVGCGSCHSVYAERDNLLVMSNRASALCVACHVL